MSRFSGNSGGSKKEIIQQSTLPLNAHVGDIWLDTSDNAYQGTVFEDLSEQLGGKANKSDVDTLTTQLAQKPNKTEVEETTFYDEITYKRLYDSVSGTYYFLTTIPHTDKDGNIIKLKHGYNYDGFNSTNPETGYRGESARSFSARNNASFVANASIWDDNKYLSDGTTSNPNYKKVLGIQIKDGVILQQKDTTASWTIGITDDNTLKVYDKTVSASAILADGCKDALTGFFPLVNNGVGVSSSVYSSIANTTEKHPRNAIGQLPNKDIIFISTDTDDNLSGFVYNDMIRIFTSLGANVAYCFDGGGSTQNTVRGFTLNKLLDDNGTTEREVADFLYVKKENVAFPDNMYSLSKDMGFINKRLSDAMGSLNELGIFQSVAVTVSDINAIYKNGVYWCLGTAVGVPSTSNSWGVFHVAAGSVSGLQFAIPYSSTGLVFPKYRTRTSAGVWSSWIGYDSNLPVSSDLNTVIGKIDVWADGTTLNTPDSTKAWIVKNYPKTSTSVLQVAESFASPTVRKTRRMVSGVWETTWS